MTKTRQDQNVPGMLDPTPKQSASIGAVRAPISYTLVEYLQASHKTTQKKPWIYVKKQFLLYLICFLLMFFISCKAGAGAKNGTVYVQPKENINENGGIFILGADLQLAVRLRKIKRSQKLPYSPYASAAVWIGTDFPYLKAKQMILWSRRYYTQLRYVAFSKDLKQKLGRKSPKVRYKSLVIGGQTELALTAGLGAWKSQDFKKLASIKKEKDFIALVEKRYDQGLPEEMREWLPR